MVEQRISSRARPGCSRGDQGYSEGNKKKGTCLNRFYVTVEDLQTACAELLQEPLLGREASIVTSWLEEACHAFSAYYHVATTINHQRKGALKKQSFGDALIESIEGLTADLHGKYGGSKEFQRFSNHSKLCKLNKVRVRIRELELVFNDVMGRAEQVVPIEADSELRELVADENKKYLRILNRLSSLYWDLTQKELYLLQTTNAYIRTANAIKHSLSRDNLEPLYWCGEMPVLEIDQEL